MHFRCNSNEQSAKTLSQHSKCFWNKQDGMSVYVHVHVHIHYGCTCITSDPIRDAKVSQASYHKPMIWRCTRRRWGKGGTCRWPSRYWTAQTHTCRPETASVTSSDDNSDNTCICHYDTASVTSSDNNSDGTYKIRFETASLISLNTYVRLWISVSDVIRMSTVWTRTFHAETAFQWNNEKKRLKLRPFYFR